MRTVTDPSAAAILSLGNSVFPDISRATSGLALGGAATTSRPGGQLGRRMLREPGGAAELRLASYGPWVPRMNQSLEDP